MTWNLYKNNFLSRLLIIYLIQLLIKSFDYSFGPFMDFTFRGFVFSISFISFSMLAWYFAEWLNEKIKDQMELVKLILNLILGYIIGFAINNGYRSGDQIFFDNEDLWKEISMFNPELTISLLLIYMIIYGIYEYLNIKLQKKDEQVKTETLKKENILAQYQALKNQIEPHFLFNSLSVLSSIVHTNTDLASEFIIKLSKTMRFIIEKNQFDLVSLEDEIAMVKDYFFLLKTRMLDIRCLTKILLN